MGSKKLPASSEEIEKSFEETLREILRIQNLSLPTINDLNAIDNKELNAEQKALVQKLAGLEVYLKSLTEYARVHALYATIVSVQQSDTQNLYLLPFQENANLLSRQIYGEVNKPLFEYAVVMYLLGRRNESNADTVNSLLQDILGQGQVETEGFQEKVALFHQYEAGVKKESRKSMYEGIVFGIVESGEQVGIERNKDWILERINKLHEIALKNEWTAETISKFIKCNIEKRNLLLQQQDSLEDIIAEIQRDPHYHMSIWLKENEQQLTEGEKELLADLDLSVLVNLLSIDKIDLTQYINGLEDIPFGTNTHRTISGWEVAKSYKDLIESMGCGVDVSIAGGKNIYASKDGHDRRITLDIDPKKTGFNASSANLKIGIPAGKDISVSRAQELFMHEFMAHIAGALRAELEGAPVLALASAPENEALAIALEKGLRQFLRGSEDDFNLGEALRHYQEYLNQTTDIDGFKKPTTAGLPYIIAIGLLNQGKSFNEAWEIMTKFYLIDQLLVITNKEEAISAAKSSALTAMFRVTRCNAVGDLYIDHVYPITKDLVYYQGESGNIEDLPKWIRGKVGKQHELYQRIFPPTKAENPFQKITRQQLMNAFRT